MTNAWSFLPEVSPEGALAVAVIVGFGFGFALERAGFGRATKLANQFYLRDMTVFRVMFSAILTAMVGTIIADGLGLIDLRGLATQAASATFLWPMAIGGFLLGAGFIISGYCPGTSLVAASSGNLDGLVTIVGVVIGSVLFAEVFPWIESFHTSGARGHWFLQDLVGLPAGVLALLIVAAAIAAFVGADKLEQIMRKRDGAESAEQSAPAARGRKLRSATFAGLATAAAVAGALAWLSPTAPIAHAQAREPQPISVATLAQHMLNEPWTIRALDLRERAACDKARVPGSECVPAAELGDLGLAYASGSRDLILIGNDSLAAVPAQAHAYPGQIFVLAGGYPAWERFALTPPPALPTTADADMRQAHAFRAAVHRAFTGRPAPPPAPVATKKYVPRKKKKGGGCE